MLEVEQHTGFTRPDELLGEFVSMKEALDYKKTLKKKYRDFVYTV